MAIRTSDNVETEVGFIQMIINLTKVKETDSIFVKFLRRLFLFIILCIICFVIIFIGYVIYDQNKKR
jgi:hypothetical protein